MKCVKKILTILVAVLMLAGMLAGCGGATGGAGEEENTQPTVQATESENTQPTEEETVPTYENLDSFYAFYDYTNEEYVQSQVGTYQAVTGAECTKSSLEWTFLTDEEYEYVVDGYDEDYGLFHYAYDEAQYEQYTIYLTTAAGFAFDSEETYDEGVSSFYYHADSGYYIDLFIANDNEFLVIEPYFEGEDLYFPFYDYTNDTFVDSRVNNYQAITGAECVKSALGWDFLSGEDYEEVVEGYDESYGLYFYAYDQAQLGEYTTYLTTQAGFVFDSEETYATGVSNFYYHADTGYYIDLFVTNGNEYLVVEPYFEGEDLYFSFYDYTNETYVDSQVNNYHAITGAECVQSALEWTFLTDEGYEYVIDGYDEAYGLFLYAYDEAQLEEYTTYLTTQAGFVFDSEETYDEGVSNFYYNADTGYYIDLFVTNGNEYLVIEPYFEGEDIYLPFYDYANEAYVDSQVNNYQAVTGAECVKSALGWGFLEDENYEDVVEGYDESYGLYFYAYDQAQLEEYTTYLTTEAGFVLQNTESYQEGTSRFYYDEANGYYMDIFVSLDETYLVIEPYLN